MMKFKKISVIALTVAISSGLFATNVHAQPIKNDFNNSNISASKDSPNGRMAIRELGKKYSVTVRWDKQTSTVEIGGYSFGVNDFYDSKNINGVLYVWENSFINLLDDNGIPYTDPNAKKE